MSKVFTELLREAVIVLARFSDVSSPGVRKWDGHAYVPSGSSQADPPAAKWWGLLTALSGMLDAQTAPLSEEQREYLDHLLFGGMGSFNDFVLDQNRLGPDAAAANQELNRLRKEMFAEFRKM